MGDEQVVAGRRRAVSRAPPSRLVPAGRHRHQLAERGLGLPRAGSAAAQHGELLHPVPAHPGSPPARSRVPGGHHAAPQARGMDSQLVPAAWSCCSRGRDDLPRAPRVRVELDLPGPHRLVRACLLAGRREFPAKGDRSNPDWPRPSPSAGCWSTALCHVPGHRNQPVPRGIPVETWAAGVRGGGSSSSPRRTRSTASPSPAGSTSHQRHGRAAVPARPARRLPLAPLDPLDRRGRGAAAALLDQHGERDSLGYFALRRDKSVIWSPTGKAAVTYRVVGGVSLASGDPIGDPEAWPGAIEPWLAEAREHGWIPAVMGAARRRARSTPGTAWTRWNWATKPSWRWRRRSRSTLHPGRPGDADRPAGVQPGEAGRVRGADPPPRGHPGRRDGVSPYARRRLARRGDRARLLHGAGPARRSGRRTVRDARMHRRRGQAAGDALVRAVGAEGALAGPDAA